MAWLLLLLAGCGTIPRTVSYPEDTGERWEVPPAYSAPGALQLATFNASWLWSSYEGGYVPRNAVDYAMVASLFDAFDLEVVALQEIGGEGAMELLGLAEHWAWTLGDSGWSQNPGILWRSDRVRVENVRELDLAINEWPSKEPLVAEVSSLEGELAFTLVVVHTKPYAGNEDAAQRYAQLEELHAWLVDELPTEAEAPFDVQVVVAGDFNDTFTALNASFPSLEVFDDDPGFTYVTRECDDYSQIPYRSLIDHIVLSEPLLGAWGQGEEDGGCEVIAHDEISPWSDYDGGFSGRQNISDHRPVWAFLREN
jgi:endonuclease/exonuclease/phosphatase family metal-dependent hydrolase